MRLCVCGGRDFADEKSLEQFLDFIRIKHPISLLVCGMARGADSIAYRWAKKHNIPIEEYPANWNKYGRSAGPIRNTEMLVSGIDILVAAPGGTGTQHMVSICKKSKKRVKFIYENIYSRSD